MFKNKMSNLTADKRS